MKTYHIFSRTVTNIRANIACLLETAIASNITLNSGAVSACALPTVGKWLLEFITIARTQRMPVTQSEIQAKVSLLQEELVNAEKAMWAAETQALESFTAFFAWINKFVRRHSLRSVSLHEEA